ncbi:MAG: hypothetical protein IPK22_16450 [Verrucomicrobiaceae bacterium]|nr:hypothetical protein [Verrucomicrobiaceae bacterium]
MKSRLLCLFALATLSSCVPLTQPATKTGSLTLPQEEKRQCKAARVIFPAGVYTPEVASERGTYYLAPAPMRTEGVLLGKGYRGGIFVANDGRHAAWFGDARDDADERAGTLFGAIGASAPKLWLVSPNLPLQPAPAR